MCVFTMLLDNEVVPHLCDRHFAQNRFGAEKDVRSIQMGEAPPKAWDLWTLKDSKQKQALADSMPGASTENILELDKPQDLQQRLDLRVGQTLIAREASRVSRAAAEAQS